MVRSVLGRIARQNGQRLLDGAVDRVIPQTEGKPTLLGKIAGAALIRVATRSVPGAIVVTGGLIAKTLHDKRKARKAAAQGPEA